MGEIFEHFKNQSDELARYKQKYGELDAPKKVMKKHQVDNKRVEEVDNDDSNSNDTEGSETEQE